MNFLTTNTSVSDLDTALLAVPVTSGESRGDAFAAADALTGGRLSTLAEEEGFKGKPGKTLLVHTSDLGARRMLLVGVGEAADLKSTSSRDLAAAAIRAMVLRAPRWLCRARDWVPTATTPT